MALLPQRTPYRIHFTCQEEESQAFLHKNLPIDLEKIVGNEGSIEYYFGLFRLHPHRLVTQRLGGVKDETDRLLYVAHLLAFRGSARACPGGKYGLAGEKRDPYGCGDRHGPL